MRLLKEPKTSLVPNHMSREAVNGDENGGVRLRQLPMTPDRVKGVP
jgi:hypothetical protein